MLFLYQNSRQLALQLALLLATSQQHFRHSLCPSTKDGLKEDTHNSRTALLRYKQAQPWL